MKVRLVSTQELLVDTEADTNETLMPNFLGMTIREVLKKSKEKGMEVRVIGSGWAIAQQPVAGTLVPADRLCTVTFGMGS